MAFRATRTSQSLVGLLLVTGTLWFQGCGPTSVSQPPPADASRQQFAATDPNSLDAAGDTATQQNQRAGGTTFVGDVAGSSRSLPPASATPESVVRIFLQAARSGDETTATQLLTRKARQQTEKEGLALEPPGTPTMRFTIGDAEIPSDDPQAAYVGSTWTESQGTSGESFAVTWILRRQADGWRIAGMATQTAPTEQPMWLNFEDPEHVRRIKQEIGGEPPRPVADDPLTARGRSENERAGVRR